MRNLINNFLRGLLLVVPMAAAIYVVWYLYNFLDSLIPVAKNIPGLSFILVVLLITIAGSYAKRYNTGLVNWFENFIKDVPLLNLIYSSIKDLMTSFMGEKKKFNGWKKKRNDPLTKTIPSKFFNLVTRLFSRWNSYFFDPFG